MEKVTRVKSQQDNVLKENKQACDTPTPKSHSVLKSKTSLSPHSSNKTNQQRSKIPTREKSSTGKSFTLAPPPEKRFNLKKKSKTSLELLKQTSQQSTAIGRPTVVSTASAATVATPRYRPGELPSYMRKNEKNVTETMLSSKKKAFSLLRKRVQDYQTELLTSYKALNEMQQKFNQSTGKEETLEEIKLITVIINEVEEMLIKNEDGTLKSARCLSPLRAVKESQKLDDIKARLKNIGNSCDTLCQEFFSNLLKVPAELQATGDGVELPAETQEVLKSLEPTARKIRDQINIFNGTLRELEEISSMACALDPKLAKSYEEKLQELAKLSEMPKKGTDVKHTDSAVLKDLKIQITDKQVMLAEKEKEISQLKETVKSLEDQKKHAEKEIQKISHDMSVKNSALKKLENEIDIYKNRTKQNEVIVDEITKQKATILEHVRKEQEAKKQFEKEHDLRLKLEKELIDRENMIEKLKLDVEQQKVYAKLGGGDRSLTESEHWAEVENLRAKLEKAILEKSAIEKEKNELKKTLKDPNKDNVRIELIKANEEINHLNTTNNCLRDVINKLEQSVSKKQALISELEHKITNGIYLTNTSKELQNELANLRESQEERKHEIENLKCELSKARIEIKQQEETIYMHQRLLRIRSELINSLQEKEATNRCRMDDLYSEISKKTSLVNQMNHEITAKAEELQNLFSTLGTKQMELTRQEHIIKMLEENNDRSQRMRVKQEEKIARLESENSELKHFLSTIDSLRPISKNLLENDIENHPNCDYVSLDSQHPSKDEDVISTREIYHSGRRRKRHIEIEVKKIHV